MNAPMALRLIDSPEPPRPSAHEAVPAARLIPAATARLAAGDWAGYRAVVAEAAEIADPHRRYEAQRTLLELGLREGSNVATLVATAVAAVDMLQAEPREPVLLNYAGVIFYELGAVKAATALFSAAQRLDPELPNVERNLSECTRRKRKGVSVVAQAAKSDFFKTSDGVRIHYLEAGSGRPIVFIPGWTMPAWIWQKQIDEFSKK